MTIREPQVIIIGDYSEKLDRINERLPRSKIIDRTTYELEFNRLFDITEKELSSGQEVLREEAFFAYRITNPKVHKGRKIKRKDVGKKDISRIEPRDRISDSDLKEFTQISETRKRKDRFIHSAIRKGNVVLTERVFVTVRGKKQQRFRDKSGKFCKCL